MHSLPASRQIDLDRTEPGAGWFETVWLSVDALLNANLEWNQPVYMCSSALLYAHHLLRFKMLEWQTLSRYENGILCAFFVVVVVELCVNKFIAFYIQLVSFFLDSTSLWLLFFSWVLFYYNAIHNQIKSRFHYRAHTHCYFVQWNWKKKTTIIKMCICVNSNKWLNNSSLFVEFSLFWIHCWIEIEILHSNEPNERKQQQKTKTLNFFFLEKDTQLPILLHVEPFIAPIQLFRMRFENLSTKIHFYCDNFDPIALIFDNKIKYVNRIVHFSNRRNGWRFSFLKNKLNEILAIVSQLINRKLYVKIVCKSVCNRLCERKTVSDELSCYNNRCWLMELLLAFSRLPSRSSSPSVSHTCIVVVAESMRRLFWIIWQ